jgi:hypothetical protein
MPISNEHLKEKMAFLKRFQINPSHFSMTAMTSEHHYSFLLTVTLFPITIMIPTFSARRGHVSRQEVETEKTFLNFS